MAAISTVQAKLVDSAARQMAGSATCDSGASSASSPCGYEAKPVAAARQPGQREGAADAEEEAGIEKHLAGPDRDVERPVDRFGHGWRRARRADGEQQRAADGMAVGGHHAPTQHVGAAVEPCRRVDGDRAAVDAEVREPERRAVGPHQCQLERRNGFVEGQGKMVRGLRQHGIVGRVGKDQRGMGKGCGRHRQPQQEGEKQAAQRAHHGFGSSLMPGAGVSSASSS
jgi:hypothetical protein